MDDSCAVCASSLDWVGYGPCGHRDVCSTCVARLRFICHDPHCCICKSPSHLVFVTKALGDYTRMIGDFSLFPSELKEGRIGGSYWYHEATQALFDDLEQYNMIKEMCRLSCSVCDNYDDQSGDGPRRRPRFRNIEQLKGHLFHQHKALMCSLCLEGRKIFICEQKLYTRAQLNQHIQTGDSEVDGTESERGGFMGHPICEFCKTPFYGDNELYSHMSTEHYTCHICQRQHPGQFDYYKNYDDLENHFRGEHFLCENEACLAKKFTVFTSEVELKRHNAMEHGGSMSRSKRNAALQIPTSFRFHRSSELSNRRGRGGRGFHRDYSEDQIPSGYDASYETSNAAGTTSSSRNQPLSDNGVDPLVRPLESLATTEASPRYMLAVSSLTSRNAPLVDSAFPPLPVAPANNKQKSKHGPEKNSMVSQLRRHNNANVGVSTAAQTRPFASCSPLVSSSSSSTRPINAKFSSNSFPELSTKLSSNSFPELSAGSGLKPISNNGASTALPTSYSSLAKTQASSGYDYSSVGSSSSGKAAGSSSKIRHSTSAPNFAAVDTSSASDFPSVSAAAQVRKPPSSGQTIRKVEDVHTANKSLVERIRYALNFDEDKYTAFKEISGEYRQGMIDAETYLSYVDQFDLLHLVLELARLCPDPERQKALVATYNANMRTVEYGSGKGSVHVKDNGSSKKGKGKILDGADSSKDKLADSVINTVRKLQSSYKPSEEETEVLSKDGYRISKGKAKIMVDEPPEKPANPVAVGSNQNLRDAGGKGKKQKKTSKFLRARLGDGSVEALLDLRNSDSDPDLNMEATNKNSTGGLPGRNAWRNGGGQKLVAKTSKGLEKQ